jgi:hypothetical protein
MKATGPQKRVRIGKESPKGKEAIKRSEERETNASSGIKIRNSDGWLLPETGRWTSASALRWGLSPLLEPFHAKQLPGAFGHRCSILSSCWVLCHLDQTIFTPPSFI